MHVKKSVQISLTKYLSKKPPKIIDTCMSKNLQGSKTCTRNKSFRGRRQMRARKTHQRSQTNAKELRGRQTNACLKNPSIRGLAEMHVKNASELIQNWMSKNPSGLRNKYMSKNLSEVTEKGMSKKPLRGHRETFLKKSFPGYWERHVRIHQWSQTNAYLKISFRGHRPMHAKKYFRGHKKKRWTHVHKPSGITDNVRRT